MSPTKKLVLARDQIRAEVEKKRKAAEVFNTNGNEMAAHYVRGGMAGLEIAAKIVESQMRD